MIDHVGNGFHRYSTDKYWHVPHFEKMLYDQAQLLYSYSSLYQITKDPYFASVVKDIVTYTKRDLGHDQGGFYSAEDADSLPTTDSNKKLGNIYKSRKKNHGNKLYINRIYIIFYLFFFFFS